MDNTSSSAARVGFLLLVATLLLIAGVYMVGDGGGFLADYSRFQTLFPSATGLRADGRVYLSGVQVGKVEAIGFPANPSEENQNKILVTLAIRSEYALRIRADSFAWIESEGLLGDKSISIRMGDPKAEAIPEGGILRTMDRSLIAGLVGQELVTGTSDLLENMITLIKEINAGKGTLGQLITNPQLYQNLDRFLVTLTTTTGEVEGIAQDMKGLIAEIRTQKGTLGKLILSEEYASEFTGAVESAHRLISSLAKVMEPVEKGEGSIGKLIKDETLHRSLVDATGKLAAAADRLDATLKAMGDNRSAAGRFLVDREMGESFGRLIARLEGGSLELERILGKVNSGEGSLGMLIHDASIAASIRDLFLGVQESDLLIGVARRAEEKGRAIRFRDERLVRESTRKETEKDIQGRRAPFEEGKPLPAVGPIESNPPAPPSEKR